MSNEIEFVEFPKMPRLSREIIVTEKIDGTNAQVFIGDNGEFHVGSRTRWITPEADNFGFAAWAHAHKNELMQLGPGRHFGEWWGAGIQRRYGLVEKRFSLFNVDRWSDGGLPECCSLVPLLYRGPFSTEDIDRCLAELQANGSSASPGFMNPEGIVVFHLAGRIGFKKTIHKDELPKSLAA